MSYTPMMEQYLQIKKENPDCILFFRLGDFYEMFFEDAKIASRELEIVLTKKSCGDNETCDMCGVPHHVSDEYVKKLVEKGYKVAICEQLENPKYAKGLVKRDIVQIISPGTIINNQQQGSNNYLLSFVADENSLGISYIDVSTGIIYYTQQALSEVDQLEKILENEIARINPSEVITIEAAKEFLAITSSDSIVVTVTEPLTEKDISALLHEKSNLQPGEKILKNAGYALAQLLNYVYRFQKEKLIHLKPPKYYEISDYLNIDAHSISNLELQKNLYTNTRSGSLFGVLNQTKTSMGTRLLREYIEKPLMDIKKINQRFDMIQSLLENRSLMIQLSDLLAGIYDLERILAKLSYQKGNARDMISLKFSLSKLPDIKALLSQKSEILELISNKLDSLEDIYQLLDDSIVEDPPLTIMEGNIIKEGYDATLDHIRHNKTCGKKELIEYEQNLRQSLDIKNLKIIFNKKLGYFIDVTKSNLKKVPEEFIKKQTLTNSERFKTSQLEEIESKILSSEDIIFAKEYEIFNTIRQHILSHIARIQQTADQIAMMDVMNALAETAYNNNYVRPTINNIGYLDMKDSRHPVIENSIGFDQFIKNNVEIGNGKDNIQIITGPNMSGKSTYLRQVAIICIMAQMGSYVPCSYANISIIDKIFTRIGASDNLYRGESTFMVEMNEMSNILKNATSRSLLILDEVGRGTSTFDGLSIAWAIVEYISKKIQSKTLFATHYHEIAALEKELKNVVNLKIEVKEYQNDIVFLRKISKGMTNKSYGVQVAKLAGLPQELIQRANIILKQIEKGKERRSQNIDLKEKEQIDLSVLQKNKIIRELQQIDINRLTPLDAMQLLHKFYLKAQALGDTND